MATPQYRLLQADTQDTPESGYTTLYAKTDGKLYAHPHGGSEAEVGGGTSIDAGTSFPATPDTGDYYFRTDLAGLYRYNGSSWEGVGAVNTGQKNIVINGMFAIWQRQSDPTTATTYDDDTYCGADRWYILSSQASAIQTHRIDGSEQRHAIRLTQNSATATQPGLAQIVEGVNCRHLRGKTVTLRLRVRCSAAGKSLKLGLLEWSGTEDDLKTSSSHDFVSVWAGTPTLVTNMAYPTGYAYQYITTVADTWQEMVYTATLGSSFNNLVVFLFGAMALDQNTTLDVESVQVEAGPLPTPFEQRSAAFEDALCKRYYEREVGSGYYYFAAGFVAATNLAFFAYRYAPKRAVPTFNTSALATIGVIGGTTLRTASSIAFQYATECGCRIQVGATLTAPAATAVLCNNTTAYFEMDAEL